MSHNLGCHQIVHEVVMSESYHYKVEINQGNQFFRKLIFQKAMTQLIGHWGKII